MTQDSNFFVSIGNPVKDEYGRTIGRVASLDVNPNGTIGSLYIQQGDGRVAKYPADNLIIEDSHVTMQSSTKTKALTYCDQIPLVWRKNQTIRNLLDSNKISPDVYDDMHQNFQDALEQLKGEAQTLVEKIDQEIARCTREKRDLNYALVNLEIEHEIGKIGEDPYQGAFTAIQECLNNVNREKVELEEIKNKLSNILLGDATLADEAKEDETPQAASEAEGSTEAQSSLPEPPVVVYVKEVGQSSA
jgi:hypothetical protein